MEINERLSVILTRFIPEAGFNRRDYVDELCRMKNVCSTPVFHLLEQACHFLSHGNIKEALSLSTSLLDISWEKINTGYWKDVDVEWRKMYSYGSLLKSLSLVSLERIEDAVRSCDMGLLLGCPIMDNVLNNVVEYVQKKLPRKENNINTNICQNKKAKVADSESIKRIKCPSLQVFKDEFMCREEPVIIENTMDHWPALTTRQWSFSYLKDIAGYRTVPVELGSRYTDESWTQKLITINEFVDSYIVGDNSKSGPDKIAYLAQHQLFDQIPELANDISIPDYCCLGENNGDNIIMNAWFGPKGTVSPLHYDPSHNFLAQVVGEKYIRLYSTTETDKLYPFDSFLLFNTSQVDVEKPDLDRFPMFQSANYKECILRPGEMLYIPQKHWHFVKSRSVSFSVSFWWS